MPKQSYLPYFDQLSETGQPLWQKIQKIGGDISRASPVFGIYAPALGGTGGRKTYSTLEHALR